MGAGLTSPYFVLLVACLLVDVVVLGLVWRRRDRVGATELCGLLGSILVWGGVYAVGMVLVDPAVRLLLERVMWLGVTTAPVAWLAFALVYTGSQRLVTGRLIGALSVVPVVTVALVLTNPAHGLVWTSNERLVVEGVAIARQTYGPLFWPLALYLYVLVLAGSYLLVKLVVTAGELYADQSAALLVGAVVPTVANVMSVAGAAPIPGLDMTPYAFSVSGLAFGYALVRYDLFEFVPATRYLGRDAVVENMRDAVLIVDHDGRIVDANPVAEALFDAERDGIVGKRLEAVLGEPATLPAPGETREFTNQWNRRSFEMTASPLSDWADRHVGHVLVFRDVTKRSLREQRLSVLNRVLRHNLRNDVMVISGYADVLTAELSGPEADHARRIRETAAELMDIGEQARTIDEVITDSSEPVTIDVASTIEESVESLRERYPAVRVETDLPDRFEITCRNPELVDLIVGNLLENAAEHNDAADPAVTVSLVPESGRRRVAKFTVADNGPPIPAQERERLDDSGETPLEHGSGLGLWIVNWCVRRLGGRLTFDTASSGNRVTARIPVTTARDSVIDDAEDGQPSARE